MTRLQKTWCYAGWTVVSVFLSSLASAWLSQSALPFLALVSVCVGAGVNGILIWKGVELWAKPEPDRGPLLDDVEYVLNQWLLEDKGPSHFDRGLHLLAHLKRGGTLEQYGLPDSTPRRRTLRGSNQ